MAESTEINHAGRAHALLSASGSKQWMTCTPSARLEEHFPEEDESIFAKEGTLAHEFGELELLKIMKLINIFGYKNKIKELRSHELYTDEMEGFVEEYVTTVIEQLNSSEGAELIIEERVDFTRYVPEGFGTCDALIAAFKIRKLFTTDLKYGKGVQVYAEDNPQLKLYALGALEKFRDPLDGTYPFDTVVLTIVQPRLNHIDSWEISVEDLLKWAEGELTQKAKEAFAGTGTMVAGTHCRFCKFAPRCKALSEYSIESAKLDFLLDDPEYPEEVGLSDKELAELYRKIPILSIWINKVEEYMLKEALSGKKWESLKLVEGRSNRMWQDKEGVEKILLDNLYSEDDILIKKLAGIGVIEKLTGKAEFKELLSDLVIRPAGKASLVPAEDKRPEMGLQSAKRDFSTPIEDDKD